MSPISPQITGFLPKQPDIIVDSHLLQVRAGLSATTPLQLLFLLREDCEIILSQWHVHHPTKQLPIAEHDANYKVLAECLALLDPLASHFPTEKVWWDHQTVLSALSWSHKFFFYILIIIFKALRKMDWTFSASSFFYCRAATAVVNRDVRAETLPGWWMIIDCRIPWK